MILDCGMHPEHVGHDSTPILEAIDYGSIHSAILTHAHQDHVGCLPLLQASQPQMPVLMTSGTARIAEIMLHNSVNVMMRQQEQLQIPNYPLFSHRGIESATRRWVHCPLERQLDLQGNRSSDDSESNVTFYDAGHILGSSGVMIRSRGMKFFYTGDVNFEDQTIQTGARFPEEPVDVLLMETTRGDALLPKDFTRAEEEKRLAISITEALESGASIMIPVFALGKTQELMAILWKMQRERIIPPVPLYVGGLSSKITAVYDSMADRVARNIPSLRLMNELSPYVAGGEEIRSLNPRKRAIYALSSGMMSEQTLSNIFARKVLPDPSQYCFFIGYTDPNSPAGRVKNANSGDVVMLTSTDDPVPIRCHRETFTLSAHSRREDLLSYALKIRPKTIFLVHGDSGAIEWFSRELSSSLPGCRIMSPPPGLSIDL